MESTTVPKVLLWFGGRPATMNGNMSDGRMDTREEEEEEVERVVYYDLENEKRLLGLAPFADRNGNARAMRQRHGDSTKDRILARPKDLFTQHPVFKSSLKEASKSSDDEGDAGEEDEEESNPFAALLQPAPPPRRHVPPPRQSSPVQATQRQQPIRSERILTAERQSAAMSQQRVPWPSVSTISSRGSGTGVVSKTMAKKSLGPSFESADARPARWSRNVPEPKRRQSTTTAQSQGAKQNDPKRRKSTSSTVSSLDVSWSSSSSSGGRLLSEILSKATSLSQQRTTEAVNPTVNLPSQSFEAPRETDDGIADTVTELRDEPFQTQFFSPSKLRQGHSHRKPRADAVLAKIRGSIGDVIRKATRRTNRDLTLLRSNGQTLLRNEAQGPADELKHRDFVIVRLLRSLAHGHHLSFDAEVLSFSTSDAAGRGVSSGMKLRVVFSGQEVSSNEHRLACGIRVKVLAPFQVVSESFVPGRRRRAKQYLTGTSLFEVVADVN